jgi:hypothetical protein
MNLHKITSLSALVVSLFTANAFSAETVGIAFDTREALTTAQGPGGSAVVETGYSRHRLLSMIGSPSLKLSRNKWVYQRIETTREDGRSSKEWSLVIDFSDEKISSIQLVSAPMLEGLVADSKREAGTAVALNSRR